MNLNTLPNVNSMRVFIIDLCHSFLYLNYLLIQTLWQLSTSTTSDNSDSTHSIRRVNSA